MSARVDDLLRELRLELDHAAPSAGFRQRLRDHAIARGRARRSRGVVPVALAAAAALLLTTRSWTPAPAPVVADRAIAPSVPLPAEPRVASAVRRAPSAESRVRSAERPVPAFAEATAGLAEAPPARRRPSAGRAGVAEVIVARDEELALRRWLDHLRAARQPEIAASTPTVPDIAPVDVPLIQIELVSAGRPAGERNR